MIEPAIEAGPRPRVSRGFDRLSPLYEAIAALGSLDRIHASQVALLSGLPPVDAVLIVGGGAGRFLERFAGAAPDAGVVVLDVSPAMLARSRARLDAAAARRVRFRLGGLEALEADDRFDLICTHYFLDLFDERRLPAVMRRLAAAIAPGGRWWCSDFAHPAAMRRPAGQRVLLSGLYRFFGWSCGIETRELSDIPAAFASLGLRAEATTRHAGGRLWSAIYRDRGPA